MRPSSRKTVAALSSAAFAYGLLQSCVTPMLPALAREYGVDEAASAWLVTGFLLSASIATPLGGRLGDMYGRGRILRWVLWIFAAASAMAAAAPTYELLLAARVGQGVGGALFPLAFGIYREHLSAGRLAAAVGLTSSVIAVGSGIGVVVVGPLERAGGSHGVFATAAMLVVISAALVTLVISPHVGGTGGTIDVPGAALLVVWLSALLVALSELARGGMALPLVPVLFGASAVAFALWILVERRARTPIVNVKLLATSVVLLPNLLAFAFGFLLFSGMVLVPAFVQAPAAAGFGFSASVTETSFYLLPQTVVFLAVSLLAGRMHQWPGERVSIVLGALLALVGQLALALWHDDPAPVIAASAVTGMGIGLIYTHLSSFIVRTVPASEVGSVSGMNTNIRNIGGAVGAQLSASIIVAVGGGGGFTVAFAILAAMALVAVVLSVILALPRSRRG
ncbi:MFS transporter [Microbacterium sp. RG1]|uniref:MFS transporter n=1 Tax=Microbacterium sp. RG1 TaxID=2489212 RepID=UPI0013755252|nr:MFS transporter [Microbacterium sp. RG1]